MKAVKVDKDHKLVLAEVEPPVPQRSEVLVRVSAVSLNRGEVRRSASAAEGFRPGWDFAGVVEAAAANGAGPPAGTRVVGVLPVGAWAERLAVPVENVAALPDAVSFAQASCLPVAGLTALHAVSRRGDLVARKVLVTGATGGVGHFGMQLAKLSGAHVVASVRSESQVAFAREHGADDVAVVGNDPSAPAKYGPFDLVLESVGGESFTASARMLNSDGVCVVFGGSAVAEAKLELQPFYIGGGRQIYGLAMFHELAHRESAALGLAKLAGLVAAKKLKVHIAVEKPWTAVDEIARDLMSRRYPGKAVLHLA